MVIFFLILSIIICIYTIIWYQLFLSNSNTAQVAGAVEYTNCISAERWWVSPPSLNKWSGFDTKPSDGALKNVEYPFIAIAPRSTLTQSGGT